MKVTNRLLKRKRRDVYFSAYIEWLSRNSTKRTVYIQHLSQRWMAKSQS
jgi:hypothetical protein